MLRTMFFMEVLATVSEWENVPSSEWPSDWVTRTERYLECVEYTGFSVPDPAGTEKRFHELEGFCTCQSWSYKAFTKLDILVKLWLHVNDAEHEERDWERAYEARLEQ